MSGAIPWHQDGVVFPLDQAMELVIVGVPINDALVDNGCRQFIDGAHLKGWADHGFGPVDELKIPLNKVDLAKSVPVPALRGRFC